MADVNVTVNPQPLASLLEQAKALAHQLNQSLQLARGSSPGAGAAQRPSGGPLNPKIQSTPVANAAYIEAMRALGQQPGKPSGMTGFLASQAHAKFIGPAIAIWMGTEQARRILRSLLGFMRGEEDINSIVRRLIIMSVPELFREMSSLVQAMINESARREANLQRAQIENIRYQKDFEARMRDTPHLREGIGASIASEHAARRKTLQEGKAYQSFQEEWRGL